MNPKITVFAAAAALLIPLTASAEPIVVEATEHRGGKTRTSSFVLELTGDRPATLAVAGAGTRYRIELSRAKPSAPIAFAISIEKKGARFELRSAKTIAPGSREVLGSFRRPGERIEIAASARKP